MRIELDYNIVSAEDRCAATHSIDFSRATQRDLERIANYILYGKTAKGNALPEAKEITAKHSTWKKKEPESLDALMENVLFDEQTLRPATQRSPYTNPKPTIDKVKDANIPGMQSLWDDIRVVEELFENEKANGKTLKVYYLRHLLIDLRKEQYHLKDMFKPTLHFIMPMVDTHPHEIDWCSDSGYAVPPIDYTCKRGEDGKSILSYVGPDNWTWHTTGEHTIDLTNPEHIYHILDLYSSLRHQVYDNPTSGTAFLLHAVECLIEKTPLSSARKHILIRKIDHASNDVIAEELRQNFGVDYATNYISTIWTKEICGAIAKTGEIDRDEWIYRNQPNKWKICTKCHRKKLRNTHFFATKRTAFDLFNPVCRECQKKVKK